MIEDQPTALPPADVVAYGLSRQQQRLWSDFRGGAGSRSWAVAIIDRSIKRESLYEALMDAAVRHEALRFRYVSIPGMTKPMQSLGVINEPSWCNQTLNSEEEEHSYIEAWISRQMEAEAEDTGLEVQLLSTGSAHHVILCAAPSLSADGASLALLVREIWVTYNGYGVASESFSYLQYTSWQVSTFPDASEDEALADQGQQHFLDLGDVPTAPPGGFCARRKEIGLSSHDFERLIESLSTSGIRLDVYLLTCWLTLIARVSQKPQFVLAIDDGSRDLDELSQSVGAYAKSDDVEISLNSTSSFKELLRYADRLLSHCRSAKVHCDPLRSSVAIAGFSFLPRWNGELQDQLSGFRILSVYSNSRKTALVLSCSDTCLPAVQYDGGKYSDREIEWKIGRPLRVLVLEGVRHLESRVSDIPILDDAIRSYFLQHSGGPKRPQLASPLHRYVEKHAQERPASTAVRSGEQTVSYGELNLRGVRLAGWLQHLGVRFEDVVAVLLPRSPEILIAMIGIWKAGGVFLPLEIEAPTERIMHQLRDSGAKVVLSDGLPHSALRGFKGQIIAFADVLSGDFPYSGIVDPNQNMIAYIIYTSGSTGKPKGVAVTHSNIRNYLNHICHVLERNPDADTKAREALRFAMVSTFAADLGYTSILASLITGGELHIIDYHVSLDTQAYASYQRRHSIDVLKICPSHLQSLLVGADGNHILPRQYLFIGGERLEPSLISTVNRATPSCRVFNHYGPTETTVGALMHEIHSSSSLCESAAAVPIGSSIVNTTSYVLDENGEPALFGSMAELYIGGEGVSRGYLNLPALTADRFVPDRFVGAGQRLYRTGDFVRQRWDGLIEFIGRFDNQVKIRGQRVEVNEIENVLTEFPDISHAAVRMLSEAAGDRLLAFVIPAPHSTALDLAQIRSYLAARLPAHMMPDSITRLERFPLTSNGKLDLARLLAQERIATNVIPDDEGPLGDLEIEISAVWTSLLNRGRLSVTANLFELGAHSLLIVRAFNLLRETFGSRLTLVDLFTYPNIRSLARFLASKSQINTGDQGRQERIAKQHSAIRAIAHRRGGNVK